MGYAGPFQLIQITIVAVWYSTLNLRSIAPQLGPTGPARVCQQGLEGGVVEVFPHDLHRFYTGNLRPLINGGYLKKMKSVN